MCNIMIMDLSQQFSQFETEHNLKEFYIDNLWYYPLIKIPLFFDLVQKQSGKTSSNKMLHQPSVWHSIKEGLYWKIRSKENPNVKILYSVHASTRRRNLEGSFENLYIDAITRQFSPSDQLVIESPAQQYGHHPYKGKIAIYYLDFDVFKILSHAKLKKSNPGIDYSLLKKTYRCFGLEADTEFFRDRLVKFFLYYQFYLKKLGHLKPKILVLIGAYDYNQMALVRAARKYNIPTIELQHGIITKSHMAYLYKRVESRSLFPEYFYSFGDYFSDLLKKNSRMFENRKIISAGFPYLENIARSKPNLPSELLRQSKMFKVIYFTSQWTVRDNLLKFILNLTQELDNRFKIIFKIHPGEKDIDRFYDSVKSNDKIILVKDKLINSIELMKIASVHSTVYSTSFLEAAYMGLPNILINLPPFTESVTEFVDNQSVFHAKNVKEFKKHLNFIFKNPEELKNKALKFSKQFYKDNSIHNIVRELKYKIPE